MMITIPTLIADAVRMRCSGPRRVFLPCITANGSSGSRGFVSKKTFDFEGSQIARTIRFMMDLNAAVTVQLSKVQLVGCDHLVLSPNVQRLISSSAVRIKILTHVDTISDAALRHQIAYAEEQERRNYLSSANSRAPRYPTAIVALNLKDVTKAKPLRMLQEAIFGASRLTGTNQILVCGVPNSGKSSLILPLTKNRTMEQRNKKAFHLPKVSNRAGMTVAVKKHVLEMIGQADVTLIDTPGLRPKFQEGTDPRPLALMLAAHVTEFFPGWDTILGSPPGQSPHLLILRVLLEAADNHAAMSGEPKPAYLEMVGLESPPKDPVLFLEALFAKYPPPKKEKEKKVIRQFHNGDFGSLVFTPFRKELLAVEEPQQQQQEGSSSSTGIRLRRCSPIVYMNEAAMRLVDIANGRAFDFFDDESDEDDEEEQQQEHRHDSNAQSNNN